MRGRPAPTTLAAITLLLVVLADILLRGAAWGVNIGLWSLAVAGAVLALAKPDPHRLTRSTKALGALAVLFALLFGLRDSDALKIANGLAIVFCVGAIVLPETARGIREASVGRLLGAPFVGASVLVKNSLVLGRRTLHERKTTPEAGQRGKAILRGLLLATPLLLVFGGLFASADAIFRTKIENLGGFDLDFGAAGAHFWTLAFALPFAGGLLYRLVLHDEPSAPPRVVPTRGHSVGITEIGIVLGSLAVLFASFIAIQFRYLFGAGATVRVVPGLSYAEYARNGFFELVWVAALALGVLVGADSLLRRERTGDETLYRGFGRVMVVMVFCVVASALMRMKLYTDAFGLTELRLYSSVFMGWLVLAFAWLLATTLRGRRQRFAFGLLIAGLGVILATNLANPDALIVRTNLAKPNADFTYLTTLGDDATAALAASFESLPAAHREAVESHILDRKAKLSHGDWREMNLDRASVLGWKP